MTVPYHLLSADDLVTEARRQMREHLRLDVSTDRSPRLASILDDGKPPLRRVNDQPVLLYVDETSLRDGLAQWAWLAGWDVETEHHLPGWGRPDLYLTGPGGSPTMAVEIKTCLNRAADARRAFQQANTYAMALGSSVTVVLTAAEVSTDVTRYEKAFGDVWYLSAERFQSSLLNLKLGLTQRHHKALLRQQMLRSDLDLSSALLDRLAKFPGSPLRAFAPDSSPTELADLASDPSP